MADDDATMLARQAASDLFWGMSHRKAFSHAVSQARLARQLEAAIPSPPPLGQLLSPDGLVAPVQTLVGRELRRSSRLIVDGARSSADAISF